MTDSLLNKIKKQFGEKNKNLIESLITNDEYDSDAIINDMESIYDKQSNIYNHINDKQITYFINGFISNTKLLEWSFSTGIIWFYWDWYKNKSEIQQDMAWNINDYGGYKITDLYVNKKYHSFKVEILQYININEYNKMVYHTAVQYLQSDKVKGMKPNRLCTWWNVLHYEIKADSSPNVDQIESVIMYCDFTKYCTRFSATFRAVETFESLISL
eukprot:408089_1